jgi:cobalt-zinc-cadmium efflux system outer membrane protein
VAVLVSATQVFGQAQLADELVLLGKGVTDQGRARDELHFSNAPGALDSRLGGAPGSGDAALGERSPGDSGRRARPDLLTAAAGNQSALRYSQPPIEMLPAPVAMTPSALSVSGPLELPPADLEGPEDGLTLEAAIDLLVSRNLDLRTKYQEIPKAEADVLTAGLRSNPLIFGSIDSIPYGQFTPQRPGETTYGLTVIQAWDINHKRLYRVTAARRARSVLQAQYQDAVRLEIDALCSAYIDVLAARENVRYIEASIQGLTELQSAVDKQIAGQQAARIDGLRVSVQLESARLAFDEASAAFENSKRTLANFLNLPLADDSQFDVRGSVRVDAGKIPPADELIDLAFNSRPDLTSYRLGVSRAQANVDLARKEKCPDVFVLYSPWGLQDNRPTGGQNSTSWGISAMATVPVFNRNQGNIRRAELNVAQTRNEWSALTKRVELEVRQAAKDYEVALNVVNRLEKQVLPQARTVRDSTLTLLKSGEVNTVTYLESQREYVDVVRQYRDAAIRLRRAAMRINTVVAMRLIP